MLRLVTPYAASRGRKRRGHHACHDDSTADILQSYKHTPHRKEREKMVENVKAEKRSARKATRKNGGNEKQAPIFAADSMRYACVTCVTARASIR